ncbi:hypothetical protein SCLARK_00111 [Spiroplasma clarkii]|uniref:hypothetical protein n=1 Tax=Spiroplasma clarkii TaxID=2139 RepID=UPI000B553B22|nr:hypothetical protein [Spiroplasma clarkii]ARU90913.1 hypothetical protein SCLARK_00111 [Spiroplasma clarkii]
MKKLLSVLAGVAICSSSLTSVVACSVRKELMTVLVNGDEDTNTTDYDTNFRKGMLADGVYQLMNAVTYTPSKYQNAEKRAAFEKVLGESGQALSISKVFDNKPDKTDDEKEFWASYWAARNTNFRTFSFADSNIGTYKLKDVKPFLQTIVVDASGDETKTTYEEITVSDKTIGDYTSDDETKSLLMVLNLMTLKCWVLSLKPWLM